MPVLNVIRVPTYLPGIDTYMSYVPTQLLTVVSKLVFSGMKLLLDRIKYRDRITYHNMDKLLIFPRNEITVRKKTMRRLMVKNLPTVQDNDVMKREMLKYKWKIRFGQNGQENRTSELRAKIHRMIPIVAMSIATRISSILYHQY